MATPQVQVQSGRVTTEGDSLFYEVRGSGKPLLLIPPAAGDGWHYSFVADILADEYRVITFDRRANARSTMNQPQNFEISQQSRDAVAVLRAVGETSAFVLGSSSGAVIALDMAKTQPQAVRAVVAHEPPLARLHPQAARWQRFFASVYMTAFRLGSTWAALRFFMGVQVPVRQMIRATRPANEHREQSRDPYISREQVSAFLVKHELLPVSNYLPDVERIRQNGVRMFVAVGQWSRYHKAWFVDVAQVLAGQLGCELVTFPGHHASFLDRPEEFAAVLRGILHRAES